MMMAIILLYPAAAAAATDLIACGEAEISSPFHSASMRMPEKKCIDQFLPVPTTLQNEKFSYVR